MGCLCKLFGQGSQGAEKLVFPNPPQGSVTINGNEVFNILRQYGIVLSGGTEDWQYNLMSREAANLFVHWYKKKAPVKPGDYTPDSLDCGDFAWIMRAFALIWSRGDYLWGYMESEGIGNYPFPNHGFEFLIIDDKTVWYADPLCMAAPDDEITEAYEVKCNMAKC